MNHVVHDLLFCIPILLCQMALVLGSIRFSNSVNDAVDWDHRILTMLVTCWTSIVFTAISLSVIGILTVASFHLAIFLIGVSLSLRTWQSKTDQFSDFSVYRYCRASRTARLYVILSALWILALVVTYGLIQLPCDWDSIAYHIPIIDHWIQQNTLSSRHCAYWYVPGNAELIGYWLVSGYSGDFWIGLSNLPIILLLAASVHSCMVALQIRPSWRFLAIGSLLFTQPVHRQLISQENDIAVAAVFCGAVAFGLRWIQSNRWSDCIGASVCIGLLAGVKYYALGYAGICAIGILLFSSVVLGKKQAAAFAVITAVCVVVLAGYWYGRNWIWTGSPLYPKGFEFIGWPDLWAQTRPSSETSTLLLGLTFDRFVLLVWAWFAQTGPASAICICLAPVIVLGLVVKHRKNPLSYCVVSAAILGSFCVYWVTPNVIETVLESENMLRSQYHCVRFGFPVLVISTIGLATVASRISAGYRTWITRTFSVLLLFDTAMVVTHQAGFSALLTGHGVRVAWPLDHPADPWTVLLVMANGLFVGCCVFQVRRVSRLKIPGAILLLCSITAAQSYHWHRQFDQHFNRSPFQNSLSSIRAHCTRNDVIYACIHRYYPVIGSDRRQQTIRPLHLASESAFHEQLRQSGATRLIVKDMERHWTGAYRAVREYLDRDQRSFVKIGNFNGYLLYQVDLQ